jgi:hypothetical protein
MAKKERLNIISSNDRTSSKKALTMMLELEQRFKENLIEVQFSNGLVVASNNEKIIKKYTKAYGKL